jgi:hypothetical protein
MAGVFHSRIRKFFRTIDRIQFEGLEFGLISNFYGSLNRRVVLQKIVEAECE